MEGTTVQVLQMSKWSLKGLKSPETSSYGMSDTGPCLLLYYNIRNI